MDSPIRAVAFALLLGTALGLAGGAGPWLLAALLAAFVAAGAAAAHRPGPARTASIAVAAVAACAAGALRGDASAHGPGPVAASELAVCEGTVVRGADVERTAEDPGRREARFELVVGAARFDARIAFAEGEAVPALLPGDRVRLVGAAAPFRAPSNPGEPDRRAERLREGLCGEFRAGRPGAVTDLGPDAAGVVLRVRRAGEVLRRALLARLDRACGGAGPTSSLLGCLLLGDRTGLDQATSDAFRDSGTAHLLSVSGLHVVLLAAAARRLARRTVPRRVRRVLALPSLVVLLAVYCAVCRFATPVVRAAVFLAVAETARRTGRRPSPLDTLAVAAALVVAVDPSQVLDVSFQLSFAAVAGLALLTRGLRAALFPSLALLRGFPDAISKRRLWALERFATATATSLAASAATAPIVSRVFGRLQPVAPLSNLAAVPLAAVLVPLATVLVALGGALPWLTAPLASAAVRPLVAVTRAAAAIPGASLDTGRPGLAVVLVSVALLVAAAWRIRASARQGAVLAAAAWVVVAAWPAARGDARATEIVVLDVGHGACVLARSAAGGDVLFDAGGHAPSIGRRTIVPALRELGVARLGAVVVSHQDADHCGAVVDILRAFDVGEIVVSPGFGADRLPAEIVAACRAGGVPVTVLARGDAWRRRGVDVRVVSPSAELPPASDNERSVVAHVTLDGTLRVLLPGDVEGATLHALANDATLPPSRVLVLPHHGRGDAAEHLALARRLRATALVASTSPAAPMTVPGALVTGHLGAIRVRPGAEPECYPWPR